MKENYGVIIKSLPKSEKSEYRITREGAVFKLFFDKKTGEIRKVKELQPFTAVTRSREYKMIGVLSSTKYVHRLLAEAYVPNENPALYTRVSFKDDNQLNLDIDNLYWTDQSGISKMAYQNGHMEGCMQIRRENAQVRREVKIALMKERLGVHYDLIKHKLGESYGSSLIRELYNDGNPMYMADLGHKYGLSRERIRQIVTKEAKDLGIEYKHVKRIRPLRKKYRETISN